MQRTLAVVLLSAACAILGSQTGCSYHPVAEVAGRLADGSTLIWVEGEAFASAREDVEKQIDTTKTPASGGAALYGATLEYEGSTVTWKVALPKAIEGAKVVFRYARLHWRGDMVPAALKLTLTGPGGTVSRDLAFGDTGGWGRMPGDYAIVEQAVGDLAAGTWTIALASQTDDCSATVDGFFIAPEHFTITADELAAFEHLKIEPRGYLGVHAAGVVRQDVAPSVWVGSRKFDGTPEQLEVYLQSDFDGPKLMRVTVIEGRPVTETGLRVIDFGLYKELPDGQYLLRVADVRNHDVRMTVPLTVAGNFISSLDNRLAALRAFVDERWMTGGPYKAMCLPTLEHVAELVASTREVATGGAAEAKDPFKQGLAAHEGAAATPPMLQRTRRALENAEETVRRLKAGHHPYEGRAGEFRRAYVSDADGRRAVYRLFVPSSYATAEKVPFILFLHGGGGDENYWPEMADGAILWELERRGYMAAMPWWHSRRFGPHWPADQKQLIDTLRRQWPKIDPQRIYVTGISMGGFGTYRMISEYPELFAAACCVSGTARAGEETPPAVPLLILQGEADTVVPPAGAEATARRHEAAGREVELHVFPSRGHGYDPEEYLRLTLDWFDRFSRQ